MDLENNTTAALTDLVSVKGKGWSNPDVNTTIYSTTSGTVARIAYSGSARTVSYGVSCGKFVDAISQSKCYSDMNLSSGDYNTTINF